MLMNKPSHETMMWWEMAMPCLANRWKKIHTFVVAIFDESTHFRTFHWLHQRHQVSCHRRPMPKCRTFSPMFLRRCYRTRPLDPAAPESHPEVFLLSFAHAQKPLDTVFWSGWRLGLATIEALFDRRRRLIQFTTFLFIIFEISLTYLLLFFETSNQNRQFVVNNQHKI